MSYYQGNGDYITAGEYYNITPTRENYVYTQAYSKENEKKNPVTQLDMEWVTKRYTNTADPQVWGPSFWFSLHNGALRYPTKASPLVIARMKGFILGLPYILPCENCSVHAAAYIENIKDKLDHICSRRDSLFKFFVDFHNMVNKRYNKSIVSYDDAYKMYSGGANIRTLKY